VIHEPGSGKWRTEVLLQALGAELYAALLRVKEIDRLARRGDLDARARLAQLKAWLGPEYWAALRVVLDHGSLSFGLRARHAAVHRGREAVALIREWELERVRWGLE